MLETSGKTAEITFSRALASAVGLSVLFFVVYGGTSYITSLRTDVPTVYLGWEKYIPFVPLMVIPYMSIDFFFFGAPFLCRTRPELSLFSKRIALAIILAGICFLLFPLQLARERPIADGAIGAIYNWFTQYDRPYNLCPSLHIALRTILAEIYARHTRGLVNYATRFWFSLIGLSTLLTWQHHVVDVIGGFVLAAVCFYVVHLSPWRLAVVQNVRVGLIYAALTILFVGLCVIFWPWGIFLAWPALATGLVTAGYFGLGPAIFRKSEGGLPFSARIILAPVLFGQWLSLLHYKRHCRAWDELAPYVWIGRKLTDCEAADAVAQGVTAVIDLTGEFTEPSAFRAINYLNLPVLDLTAPTPDQLQIATDFISREREQGTVYIHCKIGYSRTAAVAGAWLIKSGIAADAEDAIERLKKVRPTIVVREEAFTG